MYLMKSPVSILFVLLASIGILAVGCNAEREEKQSVPSLFDTKLEAEKAAETFGCSGAHKMGDQWMPCEKHGGHGHHQH